MELSVFLSKTLDTTVSAVFRGSFQGVVVYVGGRLLSLYNPASLAIYSAIATAIHTLTAPLFRMMFNRWAGENTPFRNLFLGSIQYFGPSYAARHLAARAGYIVTGAATFGLLLLRKI